MTPLDLVLSKIQTKKVGSATMACCPAHPDRTPSLSIDEGDDGRVLLHCYAGCTVESITSAMGLRPADLFPERPASVEQRRIVATYGYHDADGDLLYEVVRYNVKPDGRPKDFRQRRPDGRGGWNWSTKDVDKVLYRLPAVLAAVAAGDPVYIVEGEKDADALTAAGVCATTAAEGAGNWSKVAAHARQVLEGARVIVVPDRDGPGAAHGRDIVRSLLDVANVIVAEAAVGKDAAEHLGAGRAVEELVLVADDEIDSVPNVAEWLGEAAEDAPSGQPLLHAGEVAGPGERPVVIVSGKHLNEIADELVEILVDGNDPPALFAHAEGVTLLDGDRLRPLDSDRLLNELEVRTRPTKIDKHGHRSPATVSVDGRKLTLMRLGKHLPALTGLAVAPFMRPDGSVCAEPGYDERTRLYLLAGVDVEVPEVPTRDDVRAAVDLIDELLCDFPLTTPADRAHAFSALLTPAVRHLVPLAPLHYFNGNTAGVGKNLLAEVLVGIHLGYRMETDPLPGDEEEMRKQITAHLAEGRRIVMWDEAHYLIGRQLARLLTSARWSDRVLGANVTINAENVLSCYALGNNGEIVGDLRRRVIRIDLTTRLEQPSRRTGFRHSDLRAWAEDNRPRLLSAVLTMLRAWHCAGRPGVESPLGSFEAWTNIVGGTLAVAGVDGFLGNVDEVLEEGDSRDAEFVGHLAELADLFPFGREFTVADVVREYRRRADDLMLPSGIVATDSSAADRIGKLYRMYKRRPMPGGFTLEQAGVTNHRTRWRVAVGGVGIGGDKGGSPEAGTSVTPENPPIEGDKTTQCVGLRIPPIPPYPPLLGIQALWTWVSDGRRPQLEALRAG